MEDNEFDCHCPQYVDFLAGLSSGEGDSFFGEMEGTPKFHMEKRTPCNDFYLSKENASHGIKLEDKPMILGKIPSESCLGHIAVNNSKPSAIDAFRFVTPLRRRSKSESSIHPKHTEHVFKILPRQRSSSVNDLRPKKKVTFATTPMCLKRTLVKSKAKKIKTTEEIELEKIAELQKQLSDHLRFNERTLRKLRLQPKATVPKIMFPVQDSRKKTGMKSEAPLAEVIETVTNNMRLKFKKRLFGINEASVAGQMNVLNQAVKTSVKSQVTRPKQSKFEEAVSSKIAEKETKLLLKRPLPVKYGFHSGLTLVNKPKKIIAIKPFNIHEAKLKDVKKGSKVEVLSSNSMITPQVRIRGKENIFSSKMTSYAGVKVVENSYKIGNSQRMFLSKCKQKSEVNVLQDRNKI